MMFVFETSFEVCNKVGGIYTVVSSKVSSLKKIASRHLLLGPWFRDKPSCDFEQFDVEEVPEDIQQVFDILSNKGIYCTYGRWKIPGKPEVVLIDFSSLTSEDSRNYLKKKYWDYFKVDSLGSRWDFDEPLCFSTAVGMFVEEYIKENPDDNYIAHFHEWMCGFGSLYIKAKEIEKESINVKTIFTTHATMLGRSLVARDIDPVKLSKEKNFDSLVTAKQIGILEKHSSEIACAKYSDSFTTVSKLTQKEAYCLLGVKPELTPNGVDLDFFPNGKNILAKQVVSRERIINILKKLFPNQDFSESFIIYSSGRPEFHNKGFDILLKVMADFNQRDEDVVCFFLVPWNHYSKILPFSGISTHYLDDEANHPIIQDCNKLGLNNLGKTKVILYPCYLGSEDDEYFSNSYYDAVSGFDLGVFSSSYEPWGYTPLECIATGVPTITSNVTGFGDFVSKKKLKCIEIVKKDETEVSSIISIINKYKSLSPEKKVVCALEAINSAKKFSWDVFINNYLKAYGAEEIINSLQKK